MPRLPIAHGEDKRYQIQHLWDHHLEIIRRLALGQRPKEISKALGLCRQTISNVRNSPIAKRRIQVMQDTMDGVTMDIGKRIQEVCGSAQLILEELMNNPGVKPELRVSIAKDQLDRGGHAAPRRVEARIQTLRMTSEDILSMKKRWDEDGTRAGVVVPSDNGNGKDAPLALPEHIEGVSITDVIGVDRKEEEKVAVLSRDSGSNQTP